MKKKIIIALTTMLYVSCSNDLSEINNRNVQLDQTTVMAIRHEFEYADDGTRVSLNLTDKGMTCGWKDGDEIGVFPIAPNFNNQAKNTIQTDGIYADSHYAKFTGAGWALDTKNTYAAYYPYSSKMTDTENNHAYITFYVCDQVQNGNGNYDHLEEVDYMYAPSTYVTSTDENGMEHCVAFDFKHAIAIVELRLTVPVAAQWTNIALANTDGLPCFEWGTRMDISSGKSDGIFTYSNTFINLDLENVTTTADNNEIVAYMALLPTNTGNINVRAITDDNTAYSATLPAKNILAGKIYRYKATLSLAPSNGTNNGYEWTDLGLPSGAKWATKDIGAASATERGNYYAWGETKTKGEEDLTNKNNYITSGSYIRSEYSQEAYKYAFLEQPTLYTKYTVDPSYSYNGIADYKNYLDADDDAAHTNMGSNWVMPTREECIELVNYTYRVWTTDYNGTGISGLILYRAKNKQDRGKVTTNTTKYNLNDSHIFMPGLDPQTSARHTNHFWTRTILLYQADALCISTSDVSSSTRFRNRSDALPIRGICR